MSVLRLDAVQHCACRLPNGHRVAVERVPQRRANGACSREEPVRCRVRAVLIGRKERAPGVAREVLEGLGIFGVIHLRVKTADDGADTGVESEVGEGKRGECAICWILREILVALGK